MFFAFAVTFGSIIGASCKYVEVEDNITVVVCFLKRFRINTAVVNKPFLDDDENTFIPLLERQGNLGLHRDLYTIPRKHKATTLFPETFKNS